MSRYKCTNNPSHTTDTMTADGFCSKPECYGIGFLMEESTTHPSGNSPQKEIGVCILLMDASASMKEVAFPNSSNQATKDQLIANCAASGIFALKDMSKKEQAYLIIVMFDGRQNIILSSYLDKLYEKFDTPPELANHILNSFTYGATDINGALRYVKGIYDDFVNKGDLTKYGGPSNVCPIMHTAMKADFTQVVIPNIRVLVYTDGEDTVSDEIKGNPFHSEPNDILMGAFFGKGEETGCLQLKRILSKCPKHDKVDQFFLINSPDRIVTLRHLFRMASGISGFCPACLALESNS